MKQLIIAILCIVLLSAGAFAQTLPNEAPEGIAGNPDHWQNEQSLWQTIKQFIAPGGLTVVGGGLCSDDPDRSGTFTGYPTAKACRSNFNYRGMVFVLYQGSPWQEVDRVQIQQGARGCMDINPGEEYHFETYICDRQVERSCTDSDGGRNYEVKGTVNFEIEGEDTTTAVDQCYGDDMLVERYCDDDNSMASTQRSCDCEDGTCVFEDDDEDDVQMISGYFRSDDSCSRATIREDQVSEDFYTTEAACLADIPVDDGSDDSNSDGQDDNNNDDTVCTTDYTPVCADGETWLNSCFANLAGHDDYEQGECPDDQGNDTGSEQDNGHDQDGGSDNAGNGQTGQHNAFAQFFIDIWDWFRGIFT